MSLSCCVRGSVDAMRALVTLTLLAAAQTARALDNGVARTPVMGYNTWNSFKFGINETLIKQTADLLVSLGLRDAGYSYLGLDGAPRPPACNADPLRGLCTREPAACMARSASQPVCCQLTAAFIISALCRWLGTEQSHGKPAHSEQPRSLSQRHEGAGGLHTRQRWVLLAQWWVLLAKPVRACLVTVTRAERVRPAGLKFGVYGDAGTSTCGGFTGSLGYEAVDAAQFAGWTVDLIKVDNCHAPGADIVRAWPCHMSQHHGRLLQHRVRVASAPRSCLRRRCKL